MNTTNHLLAKYKKFEDRFLRSLSTSNNKRNQYFRRKCLLRWQKRLAALGILATVGMPCVFAQEVWVDRLGPEARINTITAEDQVNVKTVMNNQGQVLVVWESFDEEDRNGNNQADGNAIDIILQRFRWNSDNESLEKIGDEVVVNTHIDLNQSSVDVDLNERGDFLLTWSSNHSGDNDIYMRRFYWAPQNNVLNFLDPEDVLVNIHQPNIQEQPKVALNDEGQFIIAWKSFNQAAFNSRNDVYARRFNFGDAGVLEIPDVQEFLVSAPDANLNSFLPEVAINNEGDFIIVYGEYMQSNVIAKRYHWGEANPEPEESFIQVNDHPINGYITNTAVSLNDSGDAFFLYVHKKNNQYECRGRQYEWVGSDFTPDAQGSSILAQHVPFLSSFSMNEDGNFILAWNDLEPDCYAQVFDGAMRPLTDPFLLHNFVANIQYYPSVSLNDEGDFMAVWYGYGVDGIGNANVRYDVFGQYHHIDGLATATEDPISRSVRLYPNPGEGVYQIDLGLLAGKNVAVLVRDILGKVQQESLFNNSDNTLDIKELPSGMYLVELLQGEHKVIKRVMKR